MVIYAKKNKEIIMLELAFPCEENMDEGHKRKHVKYLLIIEECIRRSWRVQCEPLEIGCRGFTGRSLSKMLRKLGVERSVKTTLD